MNGIQSNEVFLMKTMMKMMVVWHEVRRANISCYIPKIKNNHTLLTLNYYSYTLDCNDVEEVEGKKIFTLLMRLMMVSE